MKRIRRSLFATTLLLGCAWSVLPAVANAADNVPVRDRARPEYTALGARVGAFEIYPAVTLTAEANDNVFATSTNKTSDVVFTVSPTVSAQSTWGRHALRLAAGATDVRHNEASSDDHTDWFTTADGRIDLFQDSSIGLGVGHDDKYEARTAVESAAGASELVHYTVDSGYVLATTTLDRLRLSARGDLRKYDYDSVPGFAQDYRDHDVRSATVRADYALSPDTGVVAQVSVNTHEYDNSNLGSKGQEYLVGVRTDLTNLIRGEVDVGWTTQDYDSPAIGTIDGLAVHARLDWFPSEVTTVTASGSRTVNDTGVIGSGGVLVTRAAVDVDHEMLRNVILSGGASMSKAEYGGISRDDDWIDANVGASYLMNRHVSLGARYYYSDYSSDGAFTSDYQVNRFAVSVTLKL